MRFRNVYMVVGSSLVLLLWILSDPDLGLIQSLPIGASTVATLVMLLKTVLYVAALHLSRKALMDYIDLEVYFKKALGTSTGSGHALVAVGLINIAIAIIIYAAVS